MSTRTWSLLAGVMLALGALVVVAVRPTGPVLAIVTGLVVPSAFSLLAVAKTEAMHNDLKNGLIREKVGEAMADAADAANAAADSQAPQG